MSNDKKTLDICEMDLAGRVPAKPTKQDKADARAAAYRARHGVKALTIQLPVVMSAQRACLSSVVCQLKAPA